MCRGQELGTEDVARAATHLFTRKNLYHEHEEREKDRCDAAIHHFGGKIVCRDKRRLSESNSRAAIHHFGPRTLYREHRKREKYRCRAATHHF